MVGFAPFNTQATVQINLLERLFNNDRAGKASSLFPFPIFHFIEEVCINNVHSVLLLNMRPGTIRAYVMD